MLGLSSFVILKSLHGSALHVAIYQTLGMVTSLAAIFYSEWMLGRDKRPFIFWFGLLSRLSLLAMFGIFTALPFLILAGFIFITSAAIIPAVNSIFQTNVTHRHLGRLYSVYNAISGVFVMLGTYSAGLILNWKPQSYHWVFALAGVLGFLGTWIISRVSVRRGRFPSAKTLRLRHEKLARVLSRSFVVPLVDHWRVLKQNPAFAIFERNFFIYGLAFMMLAVVVPVYLVEALNITYAQVGAAQGVWFELALIAMAPVFGYFYDRSNPAAFCRRVFLILAFYPLTLLLARPLAGLVHVSPMLFVYLAYFFFGAGMSGLSVVWGLASIYFARSEDVAPYMGIHVTMVGLRGAIGPAAGYLVEMLLGPIPVFGIATALFLIAFVLMWKLEARLKSAPFAGEVAT
ncbi:MAG: hypothetical protein B1H03_01700 [Planctomycetales bacterium 4484_113]|nr:MAG: hypothetical protein B1H03_01700 [Planctomycetales bacterium 4484_113]